MLYEESLVAKQVYAKILKKIKNKKNTRAGGGGAGGV
jgi:hypothetical protein